MADEEKAVEHTEQDAEKTSQNEEKVIDSEKDAKSKNTKAKSKSKDDDEEEESSDEEEQFGLFDKPVVIEGKRERKKTDFLVKDQPEIKKPLPLVFNGKGDALGTMEVVNHELSRCTSLELKPLHKLLFGRDGRSSEIKRNIRLFNGFNIEKGTKEYENKKFGLERFTNEGLRRLLEILDLEKKGTREDLKERVFDFLLNPKETGRSLKSIQKKAEKKTKTKSKGKGEKRKRPDKSKKSKKSKEEVKDEDESDEGEGDDEKEEKVEEPKKKKAKTETPAKTKSTPSKSKPKTPIKKEAKREPKNESKVKKSPKKSKPATVTVKITAGKRRPKKIPPKVEKPVDEEVSSSDDEPLAKKIKKQEPTNEELAQTVKDLLKDADLDQVTVKSISKQVFEKYPDFDLSSKKGFIKETVYSVISGEAD